MMTPVEAEFQGTKSKRGESNVRRRERKTKWVDGGREEESEKGRRRDDVRPGLIFLLILSPVADFRLL